MRSSVSAMCGLRSLTVSTTGLPVQIVTATAEAGPPTRIVPVAGNSQYAIVNSPVQVKPKVTFLPRGRRFYAQVSAPGAAFFRQFV